MACAEARAVGYRAVREQVGWRDTASHSTTGGYDQSFHCVASLWRTRMDRWAHTSCTSYPQPAYAHSAHASGSFAFRPPRGVARAADSVMAQSPSAPSGTCVCPVSWSRWARRDLDTHAAYREETENVCGTRRQRRPPSFPLLM